MNNGIHTYVYDNRNHPVGVLAAAPSDGNDVYIGWSRCNRGAGDRFNKFEGTRIAYRRSVVGSRTPVPDSMHDEYLNFHTRCTRYFKNKSVAL